MNLKLTAISMAIIVAGYGSYQVATKDSQAPKGVPSHALSKIQKGLKPYDKPAEANEFFLKKRLNKADTVLPVDRYEAAKKQIEQMPQYFSASKSVLPSRMLLKQNNMSAFEENKELRKWQSIGPGNIGGRTRAMIIDPTNPDIMYIGGVAGGVWKSANGGDSWQPLTDSMANIAISSLHFDPQDSKTIYAGTGEGYFNGGSVRGNGIFVTNNAGGNWTQLDSTANNEDFYYVNKIVVSTNDSNVIYAATRTGVHKSNNAGQTWANIYAPENVFVGCTDLKLRTDKEVDHLVVSCGSFAPSHVAVSVDAGATWTTTLDGAEKGRSTIAIAPSNQDIVYVLNASNRQDPQNMGGHGLNAIYRSDDGGLTWQTQFAVNDNSVIENERTVATGGGFGISILTNTLYGMVPTCGFFGWPQYFNQGWYDNIITVDPVNPDVVWAGGIDIFRSDDGGKNWGLTSNWFFDVTSSQYAHADQHIQVFHPNYDGNTNQTMFVGNDGGIQKIENSMAATFTVDQYCDFLYGVAPLPSDGTVAWQTMNNGYAVTQFYNGAASSDSSIYIAGAQDNGTNKSTDQLGANGWYEISGGDGGYVAIDPRNPDIMFGEYTGLSIQKSTNGGASWTSAANGITGGGFPFITTFEMDMNNPDRLFILGSELWRTDDQAESWVQASAAASDGSTMVSVGIANTNSDFVLVGTDSGRVLRSDSAGSTDASTNWGEAVIYDGAYISSVAFDPTDENVAYATVSTFGVNHLWKSSDAGATWTAIDNMGAANGLPDIPAHAVAIDPADNQRIFVGTDLGVFVSINGGDTWMVENNGFANTPTETLKFVGRKLFAFTHGRGAYRVDLNDLIRVDALSVTVDEDATLELTKTQFESVISDRPNIGNNVEQIKLTSLPTNGELTLRGETVTTDSVILIDDLTQFNYQPSADFNGSDSFSWYGKQGTSKVSRDAVVNITITPVNDAPTASSIPAQTGKAKKSFEFDVSSYFSDIDSESLTFTSSNLPEGLTLASDGKISGKPKRKSQGTVTITASDGELSVDGNMELTVKKKSSGSFGLFGLLSLGLIGLLRRRRQS